jgi:hypothetical protein
MMEAISLIQLVFFSKRILFCLSFLTVMIFLRREMPTKRESSGSWLRLRLNLAYPRLILRNVLMELYYYDHT